MCMEKERGKMIERLVSEGFLRSHVVKEAFRRVRREDFILPPDRESAYSDTPLSIIGGQTISAPHMVAIMLELAGLEGGEKVLEVGAGSGYNAALMAEMVGEKGKIISIEFDHELAEFARGNIEKAVYNSVIVLNGDGSKGYEKEKPYDLIMVTCATPEIYPAWKDQLKEGGKIIAPVGGGFGQELVLARKGKGKLVKENHGGCVFVPLRH